MRLIHFSDTLLGFNDSNTLQYVGTRLYTLKLHIYATPFTYFQIFILNIIYHITGRLLIFDEMERKEMLKKIVELQRK